MVCGQYLKNITVVDKTVNFTVNLKGSWKVQLKNSFGTIDSQLTGSAIGNYKLTSKGYGDYTLVLFCSSIISTACETCPVNIPLSTIKTVLKIVYPNGKEILQRGNTYTIKWTVSNLAVGGNVKIELLKDTTLVGTIASTVPNNGSYNWIIGSKGSTGTDFKVKITKIGTSYSDTSDNYFTLSPVPTPTKTPIPTTPVQKCSVISAALTKDGKVITNCSVKNTDNVRINLTVQFDQSLVGQRVYCLTHMQKPNGAIEGVYFTYIVSSAGTKVITTEQTVFKMWGSASGRYTIKTVSVRDSYNQQTIYCTKNIPISTTGQQCTFINVTSGTTLTQTPTSTPYPTEEPTTPTPTPTTSVPPDVSQTPQPNTIFGYPMAEFVIGLLAVLLFVAASRS